MTLTVNVAADTQRLVAVRALGLLDTPPEERFDGITRLAARAFNVSWAAVSLVDAGRAWYKSRYGIGPSELPRLTAFDHRVIASPGPLVVADASHDPDLRAHPLVAGEPRLRFFAGHPVAAADGSKVGALTIADPKVRDFSPADLQMLRNLAEWVEREFNLLQVQTELKWAKEQQRRGEEHFRLLIENAQEIVLVLEADGIMRYKSPSIERVLGYRTQDLLRKSMFEFVAAYDLPKALTVFNEAIRQNGTTQFVEFRCRDKDGSWRVLQAWLKNLLQDRVVEGIIVNLRDVSQLKQAEEAVTKTADDLARSNQELEQFAYAASHDLQEPLRKIASYTQLLQQRYKGKFDAEADKFIGYIVDGAYRMQALIRDLLMYSRAGRGELALEPTDMEQVLAQALSNLETALQANQAAVTHDPLPMVMASPSQMTQILQNLVGNAIKYHGDAPPKVHVSALQKSGFWQFSIQDNGIGIDPQYADRVFIIFQRLHTKKEYAGTGIGLAICKKMVERHGGQVWLESEGEGKGTTFKFTLPAELVAAARPAEGP